MNKIKFITETLLELRSSAKLIKSEEDLKTTMRKYDMLFVGEKFNTIYARELHHYLRNVIGYDISIEEILKMVPPVCNTLGMKIDAMAFVDDPERKIADYQITLL